MNVNKNRGQRGLNVTKTGMDWRLLNVNKITAEDIECEKIDIRGGGM